MKLLIKSTIAILMIALSFNIAYSQKGKKFSNRDGNGSDTKERIATLKKVKLLEKLELDENVAEKFLVKYNSMEVKIEENKTKIGNAVSELNELIAKNATKDEIIKTTNELQKLQKDFSDLLFQSQQEMKSLLNEVQFAKFLIFEHNFREQVQKMIIRRMRNK